jgi:Protein of unknown function (DUF2975)
MSARVIQRIVEVFVFLVVAGILLGLLRDIAAMVAGEFGTVSWQVSAADVGQTIDLHEGAAISMTHGNLAVDNLPIAAVIEALSSIGQAALFLIALLALRRLLMRFAQGDLINQANADELRRVGYLFIAICAVSVFSVLALQPMVLAAVPAQPHIALHPSISWDVAGMKNVWLDYSPPVVMFSVGGFALLLAEALKTGLAYREDSESVV